MTRTLVLGLDGCTFDVLTPMMDAGLMPNLAALKERGASGVLQSTMPPVTGPAWYSLATGRSPGSTGIYDFLRRIPDAEEFRMEHLSADVYHGRALWDRLGEAGYDVGVIDYPTLSPPYEVAGFMIAGGLGANKHACYPDRLETDLADFEKPTAHLDLSEDKYTDFSVFVDDVVKNMRRRAAITEHVLTTEDWEFCWTVIQEPDWVQHLLWKCFDENHFEANTTDEDDAAQFRRLWRELDDVIGRILDCCDESTNVVVQSDHGFGPLDDSSFRLNTWLKNNGYMIPKSQGGAHFWVKKRIRNLLSTVSRGIRLNEWAPTLFEWGRNKTLSFAIQVNAIDLSETQLFDPGHIGAMGGLYINEDVVPEADREPLLREVTSRLDAYAEEHDVPLEIYRPEGLYGQKAPGSPDLIVRFDGGVIEDGGWDRPVVDSRPERLSHQSGSHRQPGVLIATGPDFEATTFNEAAVYDLAPTLLHCYGLPIPESLDGDVLTDILSFSRPVERIEDDTTGSVARSTSEDDEALEEQLRDLGYFE